MTAANGDHGARREWERRYDARPAIPVLAAADVMSRAGLFTFGPPGWSTGIDGAVYMPGSATAGSGTEPVVFVAPRGGGELIRGWASYGQALKWVEGRGGAARGPLAAPPVPEPPRAWLEDIVLARLLRHPDETPGVREFLPPDTFTSDVRYDVYAAMTMLAAGDEAYSLDAVHGEIMRMLRYVPPCEMARYGGGQVPSPGAYLSRLAQTQASQDGAADAITALCRQDAGEYVREEAGLTILDIAPRQDPDAGQHPAPGAVPGAGGPRGPLEPPPGLVPGGPTGPVQGR